MIVKIVSIAKEHKDLGTVIIIEASKVQYKMDKLPIEALELCFYSEITCKETIITINAPAVIYFMENGNTADTIRLG